MGQPSNYLKNKTRSTFFTSLFSISLVLFFLALFIAAGLFARQMLKQVQEEFEMMVMLGEEVSPEGKEALIEELQAKQFVKSIRFISREEASQEFISTVGEDFMEIMGGINPMRASINIQLKADYIQSDSIAAINKDLVARSEVVEIEYPISEINQLKSNISRYIRIIAGVGLIVVLIAYFIISGTINLAIFSRRLNIRSMQLLGANNNFIRRPFLLMGLAEGFLGGLIATFLLGAGLLFTANYFSQMEEMSELKTLVYSPDFMLLCLGIIIFGTLLGWLSSFLAVNRFLHKKLDELV